MRSQNLINDPIRWESKAIKWFLKSLDRWRILLAENIIQQNKYLTIDELNVVITKLLDRLIFLRVAEDHGIESKDYLKIAINSNQPTYYLNLIQIFHKASNKYNLELFNLTRESLISSILIDNRVIKAIISQLYYSPNPYSFEVLPIEILGIVYENFLGKQIVINVRNKVAIEHKSQVRKASGIYYTPEYIVRYIVENTIAKLLKEKTPADVNQISIVDPACGSGIFLIGAFNYLLSWHQDYYLNNSNPDTWSGQNSPLTSDGKLTIKEKKRILLNNIYGVDIDKNAVEVTKRSLLLTCMKPPATISINAPIRLSQELFLLILDSNLKSGNSLIDYDYYDEMINCGDEEKIKPFSWEKSFAIVFQQGGFDVVIGNPPYVRNTELDISSKVYFTKKYFSAYKQFDLYLLFNEQALKIAKIHGFIGYIQPSKFISSDYGVALTNLICKNAAIESIRNVSSDKIFNHISVYPYIFIFRKNTVNVINTEIREDYLLDHCSQLNLIGFDFYSQHRTLKNKIFSKSITLRDILIFLRRGVPNNRVKVNPEGQYGAIKSADLDTPYVSFIPVSKNVRLDYINSDYGKHKDQEFQENLLMIPRTTLKLRAVLKDSSAHICDRIYYLKLKPSSLYSQKFILAILNSSLINFIYEVLFGSTKVGGGYFDIRGSQLQQLPIPRLDLSQEKDQKIHDQIIEIVDQLLILNQQKATDFENINYLQEQIIYLQRKVDYLVYALYSLNEEEIAIVER